MSNLKYIKWKAHFWRRQWQESNLEPVAFGKSIEPLYHIIANIIANKVAESSIMKKINKKHLIIMKLI